MPSLDIVYIVIQLIFLEGVLSIDNAAVLAAMVADLPVSRPVPWPQGVHWLGRITGRFLGNQRSAALKVGLLGAYVGRGLMLVLASFIIYNPWLKFIGIAYLLKLAIEGLCPDKKDEKGGNNVLVRPANFWAVVAAVELADLAFSLDNVVAAVALSDQLPIVMLGVALGILTMRIAAGMFVTLIEKEPVLERAAYVLILSIAIQFTVEELFHVATPEWLQFTLSISILAVSVLYAHVPALRWLLGPFLRAVAWAFSIITLVMNGLWNMLVQIVLAVGRFFMDIPIVRRRHAPVWIRRRRKGLTPGRELPRETRR